MYSNDIYEFREVIHIAPGAILELSLNTMMKTIRTHKCVTELEVLECYIIKHGCIIVEERDELSTNTSRLRVSHHALPPMLQRMLKQFPLP